MVGAFRCQNEGAMGSRAFELEGPEGLYASGPEPSGKYISSRRTVEHFTRG